MFKRKLIRTGGSQAIVLPASIIAELKWTPHTMLYLDIVDKNTVVLTSTQPLPLWKLTLELCGNDDD